MLEKNGVGNMANFKMTQASSEKLGGVFLFVVRNFLTT
jgi:hypothetical protein